jgi:hypothetical protein
LPSFRDVLVVVVVGEKETPPGRRDDVVVAMGSGEKQDAVARTRKTRRSLDEIIVLVSIDR